jgi:hypothetical protein
MNNESASVGLNAPTAPKNGVGLPGGNQINNNPRI